MSLEENPAVLQTEQNEIMREQARGEWKKWEDLSDAIKAKFKNAEEHQAWVQKRIHRGIEVTMLLRRSNTGPAKPGSKRAGKKPLDLDAINADILS